jgi:DNA adenine methylase
LIANAQKEGMQESATEAQTQSVVMPHPILNWVGGKTRLLEDLVPKIPESCGRYIEPFFGGGALFFALQPREAIISDRNREIINLYLQVAGNVEEVIHSLCRFKNEERIFYRIRARNWHNMKPAMAAARTIYLNKTCFNGLYRVNSKGHFNVAYGRYTNPRIIDREGLYNAAKLLRQAKIVSGDYKKVLALNARPGDFIFLDPPYLPQQGNSGFVGYTKEGFTENNHRELAKEVARLKKIGCHILLTNSNHPLIHELYAKYNLEVVIAKRSVGTRGEPKFGKDVIVLISARLKNLSK